MATHLYLNSEPDDLYERGPWPKPFVFNEAVVKVFDDMVSRSVPLYHEVLAAAAQWSVAYHQPNSRLIDVGCSTGTFLELVGRLLKQPTTLIGIDNSRPMIEQATRKLSETRQRHQVELWCADVMTCSFEQSSVIVMNYTLQFLPLAQRRTLLRRVYEGLPSGGLLFLSEKIKSSSPQLQETMTRHYEAFKASQGYAQTEIERKKEALENVLLPLTFEQQQQMLVQIGFSQVDSLLKLHNFVSFVALK